ncbi:hypothetical protein [Mycolicibacterium sp.]|uniref:hypothetical protein n=1 Tax=Mycolicibacterium sp. TaxID=2320850 RepID=UPI0037C96F48
MSTSDELPRGIKTLGIKLKPTVHAQLSFIAQLRGGTITDEILIAIVEHIAQAKDDPELRERAVAVREAIEREAAARQQAIAGLFEAGDDPLPLGNEVATKSRSTRGSAKVPPRAAKIPFGFTR